MRAPSFLLLCFNKGATNKGATKEKGQTVTTHHARSSIYFGPKVPTYAVRQGSSTTYMGTWTLRVTKKIRPTPQASCSGRRQTCILEALKARRKLGFKWTWTPKVFRVIAFCGYWAITLPAFFFWGGGSRFT